LERDSEIDEKTASDEDSTDSFVIKRRLKRQMYIAEKARRAAKRQEKIKKMILEHRASNKAPEVPAGYDSFITHPAFFGYSRLREAEDADDLEFDAAMKISDFVSQHLGGSFVRGCLFNLFI
jgi:hypothetical protein